MALRAVAYRVEQAMMGTCVAMIFRVNAMPVPVSRGEAMVFHRTRDCPTRKAQTAFASPGGGF